MRKKVYRVQGTGNGKWQLPMARKRGKVCFRQWECVHAENPNPSRSFLFEWKKGSLRKEGPAKGISLPNKEFEGSWKTRKDKGRPRETKKDKEGDSAYIFLQIKESYCPFLSAKYNNELPMRWNLQNLHSGYNGPRAVNWKTNKWGNLGETREFHYQRKNSKDHERQGKTKADLGRQRRTKKATPLISFCKSRNRIALSCQRNTTMSYQCDETYKICIPDTMGREQSTGKPTNGEIWEKRGNFITKEKIRRITKDKERQRQT